MLIALALGRRAMAQDYWTNPNGGTWATGSNWSKGGPPSAYDEGIFSLGPQSSYSVTLTSSSVLTAVLSSGNVTFQCGGAFVEDAQNSNALQLNSNAGQTTSLTLTNGGVESYGSNDFGGAGNCNVTLNNFKLGCYMDDEVIGGSPGTTISYNQTGGSIYSANGGIDFSGGGSVNATLNNASLCAQGMISFGSTGGTTAVLQSCVTVTNERDGYVYGGGRPATALNVGVAATSANVTVSLSSSVDVYGLFVGTEEPSYQISLPTLGNTGNTGGIGALTINNSDVYGGWTIIGAASGSGALLVTGSSCYVEQDELFAVGDGGTGLVNVSGGATMNSSIQMLAYIGGSSGNGTVIVSGTGSRWLISKSYSGETAQIGVLIGGNNLSSGTGTVELDHGGVLNIAPTTIPGALNLSGGGTLQILSGSEVNSGFLYEGPGATLEIGLDGISPSLNGEMNLSNAAVFAGTLDVILENGFQPGVGESFQLFTCASDSGQFSTLNLPQPYTWDASQLYTTGVITVTAVPEPVGVLGFAVGGLLLRRRTRSQLASTPGVGSNHDGTGRSS